MTYENTFLLALLFAVASETATLLLSVRYLLKIPKSDLSNGSLLFAGCFATFSTLPYLWFIFPTMVSSTVVYVVVGELLVFLAEAGFYTYLLKLSFKRALLVSFLCNLVSYLGGLLLF